MHVRASGQDSDGMERKPLEAVRQEHSMCICVCLVHMCLCTCACVPVMCAECVEMRVFDFSLENNLEGSKNECKENKRRLSQQSGAKEGLAGQRPRKQ